MNTPASPPPDSNSTLARVRDFIAEHGLFTGVNELQVGISGGADSTALLLALRALFRNGVLAAVHFHHGLRGEAADADAAWCEAFCRACGVPCSVVRLDVPARRVPGESVEAAARRCRLEYWRQAAAGPGVSVALGHHADDAVEGLLLRLARGSNASGLAGLRPVREIEGVRFIRPLLELRRAEIEAFLRECGIRDWREDRSNRDLRFRRNAVRRRWLPVIRETLRDGDKGFLRSLEALAEDAEFLEREAAAAAGRVRTPQDLARLAPALLPRVLRRRILQDLGRDLPLRRAAVRRLRRELAQEISGHPRRVPLGNGVVLVLGPRDFRVERPRPSFSPREWAWRRDSCLEIPECGYRFEVVPAFRHAPGRIAAGGGARPASAGTVDAGEEWFAASALPDVLIVRPRRPGDRLVPFGRRRPVKLQDILVNAGVLREWRDSVPLVVAGDVIVWVAGVRRAEFGRVPPGAGDQNTVGFRFQGPQGFLPGKRNRRS